MGNVIQCERDIPRDNAFRNLKSPNSESDTVVEATHPMAKTNLTI
jgi:hypothetical protein